MGTNPHATQGVCVVVPPSLIRGSSTGGSIPARPALSDACVELTRDPGVSIPGPRAMPTWEHHGWCVARCTQGSDRGARRSVDENHHSCNSEGGRRGSSLAFVTVGVRWDCSPLTSRSHRPIVRRSIGRAGFPTVIPVGSRSLRSANSASGVAALVNYKFGNRFTHLAHQLHDKRSEACTRHAHHYYRPWLLGAASISTAHVV